MDYRFILSSRSVCTHLPVFCVRHSRFYPTFAVRACSHREVQTETIYGCQQIHLKCLSERKHKYTDTLASCLLKLEQAKKLTGTFPRGRGLRGGATSARLGGRGHRDAFFLCYWPTSFVFCLSPAGAKSSRYHDDKVLINNP